LFDSFFLKDFNVIEIIAKSMLDITPYYLFLKGSKTSNHEEANSDEQKFLVGEIN